MSMSIRPRFRYVLDASREDILAKAKLLLADSKYAFRTKISGEQLILDVGLAEQHFWSPQGDFRIGEEEDFPEKTIVSGIIGPRPTVWTMFVFFYFALGTIGFIISTYGASIWMMGEYSNYVWAFPISVILMLSAYFAGKFGEKLGEDQVIKLKEFVFELIN